MKGSTQLLIVWALPSSRPLGEQPPVVEVAQFLGPEGILNCAVVCPDGRRILTSGWPRTMRLWDRESGRLIRRLGDSAGNIQAVAFTPEGDRVLYGVVRMYRLTDPGPDDRPTSRTGPVTSKTLKPAKPK